MNERWDSLLLDCRLATMTDTGSPYGAIEQAALGYKDGVLTFAGAMSALPGRPEALADQVASVRKRVDHAGPDRLPHASRFRRRSRQRIRAPPRRRQLRRDRARRRRHHVDRARDA